MADPTLPPQLAVAQTGDPGASAIKGWYTYYDHRTGAESAASPVAEVDAGADLITEVTWAIPAPYTRMPPLDAGYPDTKVFYQAQVRGVWYPAVMIGPYIAPRTVSGGAAGFVLDEEFVFPTLAPLPPPDWLRLTHASGDSYIQQNGEQVQVRANGADVLDLPLPVLSATPATLVGQDPATGLPAFCPQPTAITTSLGGGGGVQPAPPIQCVQMRCGVSDRLTGHLMSLYTDWSHWLDPFFQLCATLGLSAALLAFPEDWILALGGAQSALWGAFVTVLRDFVGAITGNLLPSLDIDLQTAIHQALFDALVCDNNAVTVTSDEITAWQSALGAFTTWPLSSLSGPFCGLLLQFTPLADWQGAAALAAPSHLCDAWP